MKVALACMLAVILSGCSLLNDYEEQAQVVCVKIRGLCVAVDTLCTQDVISQQDCANIQDGCHAAETACTLVPPTDE